MRHLLITCPPHPWYASQYAKGSRGSVKLVEKCHRISLCWTVNSVTYPEFSVTKAERCSFLRAHITRLVTITLLDWCNKWPDRTYTTLIFSRPTSLKRITCLFLRCIFSSLRILTMGMSTFRSLIRRPPLDLCQLDWKICRVLHLILPVITQG